MYFVIINNIVVLADAPDIATCQSFVISKIEDLRKGDVIRILQTIRQGSVSVSIKIT